MDNKEYILVRAVSTEDLLLLQKIGRQTFIETFATSNTEENLKKYVDEGFAEDKLAVELSNPSSAFYFAQHEGNVIGYLKLNWGDTQTELKDSNAVEIERIYVSKDYHGKKVGQILYDKAIDIARDRNAKYVWLGVWKKILELLTSIKRMAL